jgi:hypothetical protein
VILEAWRKAVESPLLLVRFPWNEPLARLLVDAWVILRSVLLMDNPDVRLRGWREFLAMDHAIPEGKAKEFSGVIEKY